MEIYEYKNGENINIGESVIALGLFDGIHIGHRNLLKTAKKCADKIGLPTTVFTFYSEDELPKSPLRIYSTKEKLSILASLGIDNVILARFKDIADVSPEEFVRGILIKKLGCRVAVAGPDFRFGKGAVGNIEVLKTLIFGMGRELVVEEEWQSDGEKISTSLIKRLLSEGKTERANKLLVTPYFIDSDVIHGDGRGKTLGFPTINTEFTNGQNLLRRGVYRTATLIDDKIYTGITNVGECPTFEKRAPHAETYIIDYDGDLYGKRVRIYFLEHLRDEKKFKSKKELIMQINVDKNTAIERNGENLWQEIGLN